MQVIKYEVNNIVIATKVSNIPIIVGLSVKLISGRYWTNEVEKVNGRTDKSTSTYLPFSLPSTNAAGWTTDKKNKPIANVESDIAYIGIDDTSLLYPNIFTIEARITDIKIDIRVFMNPKIYLDKIYSLVVTGSEYIK